MATTHPTNEKWSLYRLSRQFDARLVGDPSFEVCGICALEPGEPTSLGFVADPRYHAAARRSQAGALVISEDLAAHYQGNALVAANPGLVFARIAALFDDAYSFAAGCHQTAVVDPSATIEPGCHVGPQAVIEANCRIGARSFIGSGCVVRRGAIIGNECRLEALVYIGPRCRIGNRVHIWSGGVIGARGFGLTRSLGGWEEMPQVGAVRIGDDVEIGANTCIDRGALDDTIIEQGVKLDNQIQIGHNCRIGAHTAIAACAGVAGSTEIGQRCLIGGAARLSGHLHIADDVIILGDAMVTKSIPEAGTYGSGLPAMKVGDWRRLVARIRRLGSSEARIGNIERLLRKIARDREETTGD